MIRQAELADAQQIIPLIMVILEDMELPFLNKHGDEKVRQILLKAYQTEKFRYSHKRAVVVEEKGLIQGVAFGFLEQEEATIDAPLREILPQFGISEDEPMFTDKEAFPNEWYLDSISVRSDQRGKGVGAKLLTGLIDFASEQGAERIGLSVDDDNPRAKKLYMRQGFKEVGRNTISGHNYDHLQKEI